MPNNLKKPKSSRVTLSDRVLEAAKKRHYRQMRFDRLNITDPENARPGNDIGYLTYKDAEQMSKDYRGDTRKARVNSDNSGELDGTSLWFSLDTLKDFISRIENSVADAENIPVLGIRIYYAKYPSVFMGDSFEGLSTDLQNKHTLFLVPTYWNEEIGREVDFDFEHVGPNKSQPMTFYDANIAFPESRMILAFDRLTYVSNHENARSAGNHGGMAPPPEPEGTFPFPQPHDPDFD